MQRLSFSKPLAVATVIIGFCVSQAQTEIYPDIYSDGSCDINYKWEHGKWNHWYIELQREGGYAIEAGVTCENDKEIQAGLKAFEWGFNHQAKDGSFSGTGDAFHSVSLFVEECAHALMVLSSYRPVMGGQDYSSVVSLYKPKLLASCRWLAANCNKKNLAYDAPYTHRRYIVASAFAEMDALTHTEEFKAASEQFCSNGLHLQWENGVNPELQGYDVEYQMAGLTAAQHFCWAQPQDRLVSHVQAMIALGLRWETSKILPDGTIITEGSTRVGIEVNRNGTVKEPDRSMIMGAFQNQDRISPNNEWFVAANRLQRPYFPGSKQVYSSSGAESSNIPFATGRAQTFQLNYQHFGVEFLESGLRSENTGPLSEGALILEWGLNQQSLSGAYPRTVAAPYNVGVFLESLLRAKRAVEEYQGAGGAMPSGYDAFLARLTTDTRSAIDWLGSSSQISQSLKEDRKSSSVTWLLAADFAGASQIFSSPYLASIGDEYAKIAIDLQIHGGGCPEFGELDYNSQAESLLYAMEYANSCSNEELKTHAIDCIRNAAEFELDGVSPEGNVSVSNGENPSYYHITNALKEFSLEFGNAKAAVVAARLEQTHGVVLPY